MADVLILVGSPRKKGDTIALATHAAHGLAVRNKTSEIIALNELHFSGCQACYACKQPDSIRCVRNDEMQSIYDAIERSEGLIIATPIYFGNVTGQTKLWLDRMFPYLTMDLGSHLPKRIPVSCIYTQNQPNEDLFTGAMDMFENMLHLLGFAIKNRMIAADLDYGTKPPVSERPSLIHQAYEIGYNLITEG